MEDTLVYFGDSVKALDEQGRVGGYLIKFSTADDPDLMGDYFTKSTEFFVEDGASIPVLYDHGLDATLKRRKLGRGTVKFDDAGLWIEAQLELRDEFEKKVFELAKAGKLGWSSGAAAHLTERKPVKNAKELISWGTAEASLTPIPCEPRLEAIALKSYEMERTKPGDGLTAFSAKGIFESELAAHTPTYWQFLSAFESAIRKLAMAAASADIIEGVVSVESKVDEAIAEFAARVRPLIVAQINEYVASDQRPEQFYLKGNPFNAVIDGDGNALAAVTFADHLDSVLAAVKGVRTRTEQIQEKRAEIKAGRKISAARMQKLKDIMRELEALVTEAETETMEKSIDPAALQILMEHEQRKKKLATASIV